MKNTMDDLKVVYESTTRWDSISIKKHLTKKYPVWVIEPFHAYHHTKVRFFPPHLPAFVQELIKAGKVSVLRADEINAKNIYPLAADKAVDVVESVYPEYRKRFEKIFSYVSDTLKSPIAENVIRINLCIRLAEFYSVNILLNRIEKFLNAGPIVVYPDINVYSYLFIKKLLLKSNQEFFEHPNIRFPIKTYVTGLLENLKQNLISITKLSAQTLASGLVGRHQTSPNKKKKNFSYGVTIIGPRQLQGNRRGPDFVIDNKKILASEVVYFPLSKLTQDQKEVLVKLPGEVHHLPRAGRFFSHYPQWRRLLCLAVKQKFLRNGEELMAASNAFFNYFRWQKAMESVSIRHFITHADFGVGHIGRNLALNQAGVQTWYFSDTMNLSINFQDGNKSFLMRHPFWAFLHYDHFVTWGISLAKYFKAHPDSFKQTHVVGCLWSEHIEKRDIARSQIGQLILTNMKASFVIAAFDSSYSRNGVTSYSEGVAFAEHLLQLADAFPDIQIILKEKKDRRYFSLMDPINGPKLFNLYYKINSHPRMSANSSQVDRMMVNNQKTFSGSSKVDVSDLISVADMVISFPFTSTTFEALSVNKPAIWHDPKGYYRDTLYGKVEGVVTHGYDELKTKVLEIKKLKSGAYQNPVPRNSPLMDPYRDGKAIDRFRKLLAAK